MKVIIVLEDTPNGIFPVISWEDNGITDHISDSISMILAAQLADALRIYSAAGALRVVEKGKKFH